MIFINQTDIIGQIMSSGTTSIMGTIVASLFFVLIFLLVLCLLFGIPLEFVAIILLPFGLAMAAYYGSFLVFIIAIFLFVSFILAKNWLFK